MPPYRNNWKRFRTIARRVLPYAARGVRTAIQFRRAQQGTSSRRFSRSGIGVTGQHDVRMVYRKRRMPRRKRRVWMRKIKTARAITLKNYGTRTRLFNYTGTIIGENATAQAYAAIAIYGQNGIDAVVDPAMHNYGMAHLGQIFSDEGEQGNKIMFGSAVMDCTFVNSGPAVLELDLYDIVWRGRNCGTNVNNDLGVGSTMTTVLPGRTAINLNTRGVTPFDLTEFLAQGFKILSKKKYLLPPGNTATYQVRDPRNRMVDSGDIHRNNSWARRGLTRFVLLVTKAIPTSGAAPQLTYGVTHKYMYKILESNEDGNGI